MWRKIKKLRFWWKTLVIFDTSNIYIFIYLFERIYQGKMKKKKLKNIWREVLQLQNEFKTALLVKSIDEVLDL